MTLNSPIAHLTASPGLAPPRWRLEDGLTLAVAARRFGLTPRAIRHYEEQELVRPTRDGRGRRVFDAVQCARLELVAALRTADVPLREVYRVLATADPGRARAAALTILERRRQEILASHTRAGAAIDRLRTIDELSVRPTPRSAT